MCINLSSFGFVRVGKKQKSASQKQKDEIERQSTVLRDLASQGLASTPTREGVQLEERYDGSGDDLESSSNSPAPPRKRRRRVDRGEALLAGIVPCTLYPVCV